ncbi:MAG TPA: hypothetical protein VKN76_01215 [Kiloniellaceae bacterium]|nr:hypothetical protein [Kiloniellaceae bacterium]
MTDSSVIAFPADHPALAGHFPDNPLVPGAVLLDHVIAVVAECEGCRVSGIRSAKFLRPLRAGESCRLQIGRRADGALKITCSTDAAKVMTAILECTTEKRAARE